MQPYHFVREIKLPHHSLDDSAILDRENSDHLLILGPDIARSCNQTTPSLFSLLESMISWCIQKRIIRGYDTIEEFWKQYGKESSLNDKLLKIGYILEENLSEKHQQCTCLKAVLDRYMLLTEFSQLLENKSFRGYISTSYDTSIEAIYTEKTNKSLLKFYASSIDGAIEAYRNEQPFILKLYGDVDEPASIVLGPRFSKGLASIYEHGQLQALLSTASALFIGFEEKDPDLEVLRHSVLSSIDPSDTIITRLTSPLKQIPKSQFQRMQEHPEHTIIDEPPQNYFALAPTPQPLRPLSATITTNLYTSIGNPEIQPLQMTTQYNNVSPIGIFTSYVPIPADEPLKRELEGLFNTLKKQGWRLTHNWGRATIPQECEKSNHLATAHLILLIISREFLATDFCYSDQIKKAIKQHELDNGHYVIPIIARAVSIPLLQGTPFGHLERLPQDGKPVNNRDNAFANIATYILEIFHKRRFFGA